MSEEQMKPYYDFSGAVRGKYAARYSAGVALPDYADPDWREKTLVREDAVGEPELESTHSVGRRFLLNFLHQLGARLASPTQPASFDFLAYAEEDRRVQACPVRLVTSEGERVGIRAEDENSPSLLLAFVWHANAKDRPELFGVPQRELYAVFQDRGYVQKRSYLELGGWSIPDPDNELRAFMAEHRITSGEQWLAQVRAALQAH